MSVVEMRADPSLMNADGRWLESGDDRGQPEDRCWHDGASSLMPEEGEAPSSAPPSPTRTRTGPGPAMNPGLLLSAPAGPRHVTTPPPPVKRRGSARRATPWKMGRHRVPPRQGRRNASDDRREQTLHKLVKGKDVLFRELTESSMRRGVADLALCINFFLLDSSDRVLLRERLSEFVHSPPDP